MTQPEEHDVIERHVPQQARLLAHLVREQEKLPEDGRGSEHPLGSLEKVLRAVMHRNVGGTGTQSLPVTMTFS